MTLTSYAFSAPVTPIMPPIDPFQSLGRLAASIPGLEEWEVSPLDMWTPCAASAVAGAVSTVATGSIVPFAASLSVCSLKGVEAQFPLTDDIRVNTYLNLTQSNPSTAYLENGNSVITWGSGGGQDGDAFGVYAQIIGPVGTSIGTEFQVNTYTSSNQHQSQTAYIGNNRFAITWSSHAQDGDLGGIFYRIFDTSGAPLTGEMPANTYTMNDQGAPGIATLDNGRFAITWQSSEQDGDNKGVYCRLFDNSGNPTSGELPVNSFTTSQQERPEIAGGPNGTFAITWMGVMNSDFQGIAAQIFNANASKNGSELPINMFTNHSQVWPAITYLGSDRLAFAWQSQENGVDDNIFIRIFTQNGTAIGPERLVNTQTVQAQRYPSIADLQNNLFVTVWQSDYQDGDRWGVYGQFFDYDGNRVGLEFLVNSIVNGSQTDPKAVSVGNSTFFVAFQSNFDTANLADIYVRFFNTTLLPPPTTGTTGSTGSTGTTATTGTTALVNPTPSPGTPTASAGSSPTEANLTWLWVVLGVIGGGAAIVSGIAAYLKFGKGHAQHDEIDHGRDIDLPQHYHNTRINQD